jgi:hypothetical protein
MKKMLVLLCVVMMSCMLASAANTYYSFTFQDHSGFYFCDGMSLVLYHSGSGPKTLVDGTQTGCYAGYNTNGFKAGVSPYYQFSAIGATMLLGTATNSPSSLIYQVNATYHTWLNWESGGGAGEFVVNYGYWTNGVAPQGKGTNASGRR